MLIKRTLSKRVDEDEIRIDIKIISPRKNLELFNKILDTTDPILIDMCIPLIRGRISIDICMKDILHCQDNREYVNNKLEFKNCQINKLRKVLVKYIKHFV